MFSYSGSLTIVKAKCSRVVYKEMDKAVDDNVAGACRRVIEVVRATRVEHSRRFLS